MVDFGGRTKTDTSSSSSGSSRTPSANISLPGPETVSVILEAISQENGFYAWPFRSGDAVSVSDLPEEYQEKLSDEIDTLSFESFFSLSIEEGEEGAVQYHGKPERNAEEVMRSEDFDEENYPDEWLYSYGNEEKGIKKYIPPTDWVNEVSPEQVAPKGILYDATQMLSVWYLPEIINQFGEGIRLKLGTDSSDDVETAQDRFSYVGFRTEDSETTEKTLLNSLNNLGVLSDEEVTEAKSGELSWSDISDMVRAQREEKFDKKFKAVE